MSGRGVRGTANVWTLHLHAVKSRAALQPYWEELMVERVFDRIPSKPDPIRQVRYVMAPLVAGLAPRSYTWRVPYTLDQGREGACVAHGVTHEALARPVVVDFTAHLLPSWAGRAQRQLTITPYRSQAIAQAFAFDLYDWCRKNDEWPGENYDGT